MVATFEVEGRTIRAAVHFSVTQHDDVIAVTDYFPDGFIVGQRVARLIHIAKVNCVAVADGSRIRLFIAREHFEQCRFTRAVRADDAHNTTRRQREGQIFDQKFIAIGFCEVVDLDDFVTKAGTVWNDDLCAADFFAL